MTAAEIRLFGGVIICLPSLLLMLRAFATQAENNLYNRIVKTTFDLYMAMIILVAASPILLFCAAGIAISSKGPVFFLQYRVGQHGMPFKIIKFRTMHYCDCQGCTLTSRSDPRIFWFGACLRRLSLDELPQLFNVLAGEMSLVGPRPHMPEARAAGILYHEAVQNYGLRHEVKPGITGWAQIHGWRGPTETVEQLACRVEHDIWYTRHCNLAVDMEILFKTILVAFFHENAF